MDQIQKVAQNEVYETIVYCLRKMMSGSAGMDVSRRVEFGKHRNLVRTFLILLSRNPHLLERAEPCENTAAYPCRVLAFRGRRNADLRLAKSQLLDFVQ